MMPIPSWTTGHCSVPAHSPCHILISGAPTGDDGGHPPADGIVETHGPEVDVAGFRLHAVDVEALNEEPGEGGEEEAVEEDGDHGAEELGRQKALRDSPAVPALVAPATRWPQPHGPGSRCG